MAGKPHIGWRSAGMLLPALLLCPAVLLSNAPAAPVAAFNVTPLRIELDSQAQFQTFQVRNESGQRMAVQARGFAWTQADGEDSYAPTTDIAISPSIIEIEPGMVQHFKLLRRQTSRDAREASYRLVIDQLPAASQSHGGASATRLRISIPVFVNRNLAAPARLGWSTERDQLRVTNGGGRSVKFSRIAITAPDGKIYELPLKGPRYVLSGASTSWTLPDTLSCVPAGSVLTGIVDNGPYREPIQQSCG